MAINQNEGEREKGKKTRSATSINLIFCVFFLKIYLILYGCFLCKFGKKYCSAVIFVGEDGSLPTAWGIAVLIDKELAVLYNYFI